MNEPGTQPQTLLESVNELRKGVVYLTRVVESDYPDRNEVERRFINKKTFRRGAFIVTGMLIIGFITAFFATFTTLSICFLNERPYSACNVIPGFKENQNRTDIIIQEFRDLQEVTKLNDRRLNRIERRLQ